MKLSPKDFIGFLIEEKILENRHAGVAERQTQLAQTQPGLTPVRVRISPSVQGPRLQAGVRRRSGSNPHEDPGLG